MIKEAKGRYEEEMTKKMREKDNRGKDMWKDINRLSGRDVKETDDLEVYEGNRRMEDEEAGKMVEKQWKGQFKDGRRDLTPIHSGYWNGESVEEIEKIYEIDNKEKEEKNEKTLIKHEKPVFDELAWNDEIKKIKTGKSSGPGKMKNEFFIAMDKEENCKRIMIQCFNNVIGGGNIPEIWNTSRIRLIKKTLKRGVKRTEKDYRPIALTPVSYRIMMSFIRKDVEKHLVRNGVIKWNQVGFTEGGRAEYNHFTLQYIIEMAWKKGAVDSDGTRF